MLLLLLLLPPLALAFLPLLLYLPLVLVLLDMSLCARLWPRARAAPRQPKCLAYRLVLVLVRLLCTPLLLLVCVFEVATARGTCSLALVSPRPTRTRQHAYTRPAHGACAALAGCCLSSTNPHRDPTDAWARSPRLHKPRPLGHHQTAKRERPSACFACAFSCSCVVFIITKEGQEEHAHVANTKTQTLTHTSTHTQRHPSSSSSSSSSSSPLAS